MNFEETLKNAVGMARKKTFDESDQLSLGEILLKLDAIIEKNKDKEEKPSVCYDFEYLFPTDIDSWRGIYAELALNFKKEGDPLNIIEFRKLIFDSIGKTFEGYKGGDFTMHKNTPVWVANYGNSGNTAVIDIMDKGYEVVIITGYREV